MATNYFSKKSKTKKKAKKSTAKPAAKPPVLSGYPATEYAARIGGSGGDIKSQLINVKEPARITVIVPNGVNPRDIRTQLEYITDLIRFK